jgi:ABC-2 type transport system permease protein
MSTLAYTLTDSATMLRRNLRRLLRYPSMTVLLVGMPIVFLLLFVYVFGGQLGAGFTGGHDGRGAYLDYVMPGILLTSRSCGCPRRSAWPPRPSRPPATPPWC